MVANLADSDTAILAKLCQACVAGFLADQDDALITNFEVLGQGFKARGNIYRVANDGVIDAAF